MKTLRVILALALTLLPLAEAHAATGYTQITVKDAGGTTRNINVLSSDAALTGNLNWANVICDQAAGTTCASVGTAGSPSTNALTIQPVTLGSGTAANAARVELANNGTGVLATVGAVTTVSTVTTLSTLTGSGVASAAADSGNPHKIGGKYNASPITLTDGNRGDAQLDINGYLKVNVATATGLAQGSTTSGQTGSLVMGAVTTAAPSYTNAQTSPASLTTAGDLRTVFSNTTLAVTNTGTFASQATLSAETTKVIGTVRNVGNVGGVFDAVSGAAVPANLLYTGVNVGGNLTPVVGDPCKTVAKTYTPIAITTATTTRIVAPTSSKKTYVCGFSVQTASANNVGIVEGTGGTCGSGTAGVYGGTTAGSGLNLAANQGIAWGNGDSQVMATAGTNVDLCLITSAGTNLAGHVSWVAQ